MVCRTIGKSSNLLEQTWVCSTMEMRLPSKELIEGSNPFMPTMIKKCPKCGSEKLQRNSSHIRIRCKECGWIWKQHRRGLETMIEEMGT